MIQELENKKIKVSISDTQQVVVKYGTKAGEVLSLLDMTDKDILAVKVNNSIRNLDYELCENSKMVPVTYNSSDGYRIYIRTVKFMLYMALKRLYPKLDIEGVLLTMLSVNTNLGLEVISSIKEFFKERVYDTIIPRLIELAEAPSHGKTILDYDPRGKGTKAYINLAKEVIERNGTKEESVG